MCIRDSVGTRRSKTGGIMARGSIASRPFLKQSSTWSCRSNFNDQTGLLSSMPHEQLYTNSVLSGLRNVTFDEFTGLTLSVSGRGNGESAPLQPLTGLGSRSTPGGNGVPCVKLVSTTGSILVLTLRRSHSINWWVLCSWKLWHIQSSSNSSSKKQPQG